MSLGITDSLLDFCDLIDENINTDFFNKLSDIKYISRWKIDISLWLNNYEKQLIDFSIDNEKMKINRIIARWHWTEVMLFILKYAIENWIWTVDLKVEPLNTNDEITFDKAYEYLINFYWSFWFRRVWTSSNMILNIYKLSERDIFVLNNRLKRFIEWKKWI